VPRRAPVDTAVNLLFGLLALQNNFIDRDALVAAFNSWLAHRSRRLGEILEERGALSASRRALMDELVEEHLQLHGNAPEHSLAALGPIGAAGVALSQVADPEVRACMAWVLTDPQLDEERDRTASFGVTEDSTSAGARFQILRPHARGGLGEVFVALDHDLHREVALKEIQLGFVDDPRHRARFEFEAVVTGGLEHPGIVPVYALGHTPDGRPYYAMRFIRGNSLKEAIRRFYQAERQPGRDRSQSALEFRELLGRFKDVCHAISYAHSRAVLHRDLKPGNIMLGPYGETLVVDWGMAKTIEQSGVGRPLEAPELPLLAPQGIGLEATRAGSTMGTPGYMSPEQAAGRLDQIGPRTDVYGLGATLYHLLTDRAPCEAEQVGEVLQQAQTGNILRPRTFNPRVAPALEAICLKAMAREPERRYDTAAALKSDLERWLGDEPVSAWREPWGVRARRWLGRHHTLVAAAAATILVAAVSLALATVLLQSAPAARSGASRSPRKTSSSTTIRSTGSTTISWSTPRSGTPAWRPCAGICWSWARRPMKTTSCRGSTPRRHGPSSAARTCTTHRSSTSSATPGTQRPTSRRRWPSSRRSIAPCRDAPGISWKRDACCTNWDAGIR
jgi:serine/threonine-protein kinase